MSLYRVSRRYSNSTIKLVAGRVVDLDDDTAALIERDSAGVLQALDDIEAGQITAGLTSLAAHLGFPIKADWRPDTPEPHVATGGGEVMSSSNMVGLVRGR